METIIQGNPKIDFNRKFIFFLMGLVLLAVFYFLPVPAGMKPEAMRTLGVMATTVFWWLTETLPISITALMIPVMVISCSVRCSAAAEIPSPSGQ